MGILTNHTFGRLTSVSDSFSFLFFFLLFLVSEGLLFVSFFWTSFHSLSSPSLGIWPGEGFYVPDPCELTFEGELDDGKIICPKPSGFFFLFSFIRVCSCWHTVTNNFFNKL